jgi:hypothetical protein
MPNDLTPFKQTNRFHLASFLEGHSRAFGMFQDRLGNVRRRFEVALNGTWQDQDFVLVEDFLYDDGETERRVWRVNFEDDGRFTATAADVVGVARGRADAGSISMRYKFRLKVGARDVIVDFDDRLYRVGQQSVLNRAVVSKWGVKIGEVTLFFEGARTPQLADAA